MTVSTYSSSTVGWLALAAGAAGLAGVLFIILFFGVGQPFGTLNDLFIERWAKPYYEYCAKRGLEFTGHYWEHEWSPSAAPARPSAAPWRSPEASSPHRPG